MTQICLADDVKEIIRKTLGVASLSEVIDMDYKDLTLDQDVNRDAVAIYSKRIRGSVRLSSGRYYTVKEYHERIQRVKALKLP